MSEIERPITEDDLHAFVDGQLDAARLPAVERHLEQDQSAAIRAAAYKTQRAALRAAFAEQLAEPIPPLLDPRRLMKARDVRRRTAWQVAAALLLAFSAGSGGGWLVRGQMSSVSPAGIPALAREALISHAVYIADRGRPVELGPTRQDVVLQWLSNRLDHPLKVLDLTATGYHFMGGRLTATDLGPAAMLIYGNNRGTKLTVFVRPMSNHRQDTKTIRVGADNIDGYAWICDGMGYAVLAVAQTKDLHNIAAMVRHQVDPT